MQILTGTRWGLPLGGRPACKLDEGESVVTSLQGIYKGHMCVGKRKVSCLFFAPTISTLLWIYCSKSRFIDIVLWAVRKNLNLSDVFALKYLGKMLVPMTEEDILR